MCDNSLDNYHVGQDDIRLHRMEQKQQKEKKNKILYSAQYETNLIDLITLNHVAVFTKNHSLNNEKIMNNTMA